MSDIVIKKHDFVEAKEKIKKFSENLPQIETLQTVATIDEGFFIDSKHKVTGDELNKRLRVINEAFIKLNGLNIDIVREFRAVYEAFEFLDKDYVSSILCAIESAAKASDEALQASEEAAEIGKRAKETSDNLNSVVDVLGKLSKSNNEKVEHLKKRLQSINHLDEVDGTWNEVQSLKCLVENQKTQIDTLCVKCADVIEKANLLYDWREEFEQKQEKRWKHIKIGAILLAGLWIASVVFVFGKVGL